ncbi:uncharacterized protein LOC135492608 [Lineus longissimus]|uniref:uncharacterized protein LOC135492608 n=1 Tax=Lineus longissimus TaxID=88925 RepID=UPI00315CF0EA
MESIDEEDWAKGLKDLDLQNDMLPIEKALGVQWNPETDSLGLKLLEKSKPATRRGILSLTSSLYDPLGLLSPIILKAKIILQDLCRLKLGWDEEIPEQKLFEWQSWLGDLGKISNFEVDRCIKPKDFGEIKSAQLCHFSDASGVGYGVVSFLRIINASGRIHCVLIFSKSRVAPLKEVTIPRMELKAATVAVRVDTMLKRELGIPLEMSHFWTDSTSVLKYIRNKNTRFKTFVANRIQVIHDGSLPCQRHYIDTKSNSADVTSRGQSAEEFMKNETWLRGPEFLCTPEEDWPTYPDVPDSIPLDKADPEVKSMRTDIKVDCDTSNKGIRDGVATVEKLINYHSSWHKLKVSVGWILKVREELRRRVRIKKGLVEKVESEKQAECLTANDLSSAESAILSFVQYQCYQEEINCLVKEPEYRVKKMSKLSRLDPVCEDNLLRVEGRLSRAVMPEESKHPVILPKNNHVTMLIIRQIHEDLLHSGRNHVLSQLRRKFWVINANSTVRNVIGKCIVCRRQNAKFGEQFMSDLPEDRLIPDEPPFTRCGVDYFGPIEVKRGRVIVKRYGVLFTCLAIRAVHIEVADTLDTDSCINAIRRFIARRGQVVRMRSDNGTNLVASERELREAIMGLDHDRIHRTLLRQNIDWVFSPPTGSHHGGVYERKIKSVKKVMKSVLKEQTLNEQGLRTLLCEIEAVLNGCPITKASDDPLDLEALTPNHLLLLKCKPNLPPGLFDKDDIYAKRRWRQVQYLAYLFWHWWVKEYLLQLQERQKWLFPRRNLQTDDIVIIADEASPRNSWPLAKVLETFPDRRGFVRKVRVRTRTGSVLERPVPKLCLLLEKDTYD